MYELRLTRAEGRTFAELPEALLSRLRADGAETLLVCEGLRLHAHDPHKAAKRAALADVAARYGDTLRILSV